MQKLLLASVLVLFTSIIFPILVVQAEHVFETPDAFAQHLDISQISAEKFIMTVDGDSYDMYYGYSGSIDSMGSDKPHPILSHMLINQEKKSLEITFSEVKENSVFWVQMPDDVISAEKGKFKVFVDGKDTLYDLTIRPDGVGLGLIVPKDGQHVEIIGTKVIPEFGTITMVILTVAIISIIVVTAKSRVTVPRF